MTLDLWIVALGAGLAINVVFLYWAVRDIAREDIVRGRVFVAGAIAAGLLVIRARLRPPKPDTAAMLHLDRQLMPIAASQRTGQEPEQTPPPAS